MLSALSPSSIAPATIVMSGNSWRESQGREGEGKRSKEEEEGQGSGLRGKVERKEEELFNLLEVCDAFRGGNKRRKLDVGHSPLLDKPDSRSGNRPAGQCGI
eukprot:768589-Hanusia_phi.AAC.4